MRGYTIVSSMTTLMYVVAALAGGLGMYFGIAGAFHLIYSRGRVEVPASPLPLAEDEPAAARPRGLQHARGVGGVGLLRGVPRGRRALGRVFRPARARHSLRARRDGGLFPPHRRGALLGAPHLPPTAPLPL